VRLRSKEDSVSGVAFHACIICSLDCGVKSVRSYAKIDRQWRYAAVLHSATAIELDISHWRHASSANQTAAYVEGEPDGDNELNHGRGPPIQGLMVVQDSEMGRCPKIACLWTTA
jgi:hypothetical protein